MMPVLNEQDDCITHIVNLLREKRKGIFSVQKISDQFQKIFNTRELGDLGGLI